jgi:hypothetical protein
MSYVIPLPVKLDKPSIALGSSQTATRINRLPERGSPGLEMGDGGSTSIGSMNPPAVCFADRTGAFCALGGKPDESSGFRPRVLRVLGHERSGSPLSDSPDFNRTASPGSPRFGSPVPGRLGHNPSASPRSASPGPSRLRSSASRLLKKRPSKLNQKGRDVGYQLAGHVNTTACAGASALHMCSKVGAADPTGVGNLVAGVAGVIKVAADSNKEKKTKSSKLDALYWLGELVSLDSREDQIGENLLRFLMHRAQTLCVRAHGASGVEKTGRINVAARALGGGVQVGLVIGGAFTVGVAYGVGQASITAVNQMADKNSFSRSQETRNRVAARVMSPTHCVMTAGVRRGCEAQLDRELMNLVNYRVLKDELFCARIYLNSLSQRYNPGFHNALRAYVDADKDKKGGHQYSKHKLDGIESYKEGEWQAPILLDHIKFEELNFRNTREAKKLLLFIFCIAQYYSSPFMKDFPDQKELMDDFNLLYEQQQSVIEVSLARKREPVTEDSGVEKLVIITLMTPHLPDEEIAMKFEEYFNYRVALHVINLSNKSKYNYIEFVRQIKDVLEKPCALDVEKYGLLRSNMDASFSDEGKINKAMCDTLKRASSSVAKVKSWATSESEKEYKASLKELLQKVPKDQQDAAKQWAKMYKSQRDKLI